MIRRCHPPLVRPEWLRTFVAVDRAGSATAGARQRGLSPPAARQLAALQALTGGPERPRWRGTGGR